MKDADPVQSNPAAVVHRSSGNVELCRPAPTRTFARIRVPSNRLDSKALWDAILSSYITAGLRNLHPPLRFHDVLRCPHRATVLILALLIVLPCPRQLNLLCFVSPSRRVCNETTQLPASLFLRCSFAARQGRLIFVSLVLVIDSVYLLSFAGLPSSARTSFFYGVRPLTFMLLLVGFLAKPLC